MCSATAPAVGCLSLDDRTLAVVPNPIALDDFENMMTKPRDPRFNDWEDTAYNTDMGDVTESLVTPGNNSVWCLSLDWQQLTDPPNGVPDFPGALVRTQIPGSIDLRGYTRLAFGHRYVNTDATGACKPLQSLLVRWLCSELGSGYEKYVLASSDWSMAVVAFDDFAEVAYLGPKGVARKDCLSAVDELQFLAQPILNDGDCSSGTLFFDNLSIR